MRLWLQDPRLSENPCSVMQRGFCSTAIKMDGLAGKRHERSQVKLQALTCQVEILVFHRVQSPTLQKSITASQDQTLSVWW